ncbi:MAG: rhodanese family protein [Tardiphaga sp.]|uniref:rhodanese family protein n=1 Tax=Tardiphaga sp. TaxID=1926292 RepID=UPI00199470CF|nr:rhodanese family protein [Tardiphaga sp.]MBC7585141.1 rhodanese family protein [Tardiphaga sp.]
MTLPHISPEKARQMVASGAVLVDIREADEHARSRIAQARHEPLSKLGAIDPGADAPAVIFHCKSGGRTAANVERLASSTDCEAFILEGGIEAWKSAGLPVVEDKKQPIEMMRQVQIVAGSMVVTGAVLGALLHPGFYALSGFVGAGLVFAGVSGTCMMAKVLALAPWNQRAPLARG